MKKRFLYIIYIIVAGANLACSDSWEDKYTDKTFEGAVAATLIVDAEKLEFTDQGASKQLGISANCRWTASTSAKWLTLSTDHGGGNASLTVTVETYANTTQDRSATITISNGIKTYTVSVIQSAMKESLEVMSSSLSYNFEGGQNNVNVKTNVSWTVSSSASWLKTSKSADGNSFMVNVEKNIDTQSRQATITVKGVAMSKTVEVKQTGVQAPAISKLTTTDLTKHEVTCVFRASSQDIDITEYGICYSSSFQTPSQANAEVLKQQGGGRNVSHSFRLTGLISKTTYYVRPYIITALGTLYGETIQFTTPASAPSEDDNGTPND